MRHKLVTILFLGQHTHCSSSSFILAMEMENILVTSKNIALCVAVYSILFFPQPLTLLGAIKSVLATVIAIQCI